MGNAVLVSFVSLLLLVQGTFGYGSSYDIEVEDIDITSWEWESARGSRVLVNVDSFGAVGDGVSDDTQAFIKAWNISCSTARSVFTVPAKRKYLVHAMRFRGTCAERFIVQIDGTIVAPDDPKKWDPKYPRTWLQFSKLTGVLFQGSGVIDGSGSNWWAASCKRNKINPCKGAPTALTIDSSSTIKVKGLKLPNSQQMHFVVSRCHSVHLSGIKVLAPGNSPNTDGIHITASTNVIMENCKIGTGNDCISIVNGSSNIKMKNIYCGPGHGIRFGALQDYNSIPLFVRSGPFHNLVSSIGSLGKKNSTGIVTKVVLDTAFLKETTKFLINETSFREGLVSYGRYAIRISEWKTSRIPSLSTTNSTATHQKLAKTRCQKLGCV